MHHRPCYAKVPLGGCCLPVQMNFASLSSSCLFFPLETRYNSVAIVAQSPEVGRIFSRLSVMFSVFLQSRMRSLCVFLLRTAQPMSSKGVGCAFDRSFFFQAEKARAIYGTQKRPRWQLRSPIVAMGMGIV